jgi:thiol-disulfide isomerase/thioredoxin
MRSLLFGLAVLTAIGCGTTTGATGDKKGSDKPAGGEVSVKVLSFADFQTLVAGHKGKVVVLDCWSTTCPPCMKEFPGLVELHKKYAPDVACVSLSFDNQGLGKIETIVEKQVKPFLQSQGATFDNVVTLEDDEFLNKKLEIASIPVVFVYDREGKVHKKYTNDQAKSEADHFTYKHVEETVKELLAKK